MRHEYVITSNVRRRNPRAHRRIPGQPVPICRIDHGPEAYWVHVRTEDVASGNYQRCMTCESIHARS